jgi:hypothetical protein
MIQLAWVFKLSPAGVLRMTRLAGRDTNVATCHAGRVRGLRRSGLAGRRPIEPVARVTRPAGRPAGEGRPPGRRRARQIRWYCCDEGGQSNVAQNPRPGLPRKGTTGQRQRRHPHPQGVQWWCHQYRGRYRDRYPLADEVPDSRSCGSRVKAQTLFDRRHGGQTRRSAFDLGSLRIAPSSIRERGTATSNFDHRAITEALILVGRLKLPKVTWPWLRAGNGLTDGASAKGRKGALAGRWTIFSVNCPSNSPRAAGKRDRSGSSPWPAAQSCPDSLSSSPAAARACGQRPAAGGGRCGRSDRSGCRCHPRGSSRPGSRRPGRPPGASGERVRAGAASTWSSSAWLK